MQRDEILDCLMDKVGVIRGYGAQRLQLFGSYARGEATDTSDVDFLVKLEPKTFDCYMDLKFYLEDVLKHPVDLVLEDSLKPALRNTILNELVDVPGL